MPKLFSNQNKKFLKQINKSELELNNFLTENWKFIFPQYIFITNEFRLEGNVRSKGTSGRIDILTFNPESKNFLIFELKKDQDKNIRNQASDYKDFIEDHFAEIYLQTIQKFNIKLPKYNEIAKDSVEIFLMAKQFSQTDIEKAKKSKGNITLIKYFWFEDDLFLIDYLNNDPDDILEKMNTEKIKKIKNVIEDKHFLSEADIFFAKKKESKRLFYIFLNSLNKISNTEIIVQDTKIKLIIKNETFSIIGYSGKTGRKSFLQINTNIDVSNIDGLLVDDRVRPDGSKKGSLGIERYEVFIQNEFQIINFIDYVKSNL
jgi:hypothetical protein